jgi:Uma2 family endonuclease
MKTAMLQGKKNREKTVIGPGANGAMMTPEEFDRAEFANGWRYELINGVLIVSPIPSEAEADPNEELGFWLRKYQEEHPKGAALDKTLSERIVKTGANRRRPDRVIWTGLGRLPHRDETPTIIAEFVSKGKRDRERDYETKRDEYMEIRVKEYWVIDRFDRCMVVFKRRGDKIIRKVIGEDQTYKTPLLPGFELPLAKLLALADSWKDQDDEPEILD